VRQGYLRYLRVGSDEFLRVTKGSFVSGIVDTAHHRYPTKMSLNLQDNNKEMRKNILQNTQ